MDFILVDWSNDIDYEPTAPGGGSGMGRRDLAAIEAATVPLFEVFSSVPGAPRIAILSGSPANASVRSYSRRLNYSHHSLVRKPLALSTVYNNIRAGQVYTTLPGGRLREKANQIHTRFVQNGTLGATYFQLDGKPLLVDYVGTPAHFQGDAAPGPWADNRFTMRHLTGFVTQQPSLFRTDATGHQISTAYWSWEDRGAGNASFPVVGGHPEVMVVLAANRGNPGGWTSPSLRVGRSALTPL